jgi:hypothetical protein
LRNKAVCGIALTLIVAAALLSIFHVQISDAMIDTRRGSEAIDSPFFPSSWNRPCGGTADDRVPSVIQTNDGGYAIAGWDGANALFVKTDSSGNMQWNKTYGGLHSDVVYSVVQTGDGGYALGGEGGE